MSLGLPALRLLASVHSVKFAAAAGAPELLQGRTVARKLMVLALPNSAFDASAANDV